MQIPIEKITFEHEIDFRYVVAVLAGKVERIREKIRVFYVIGEDKYHLSDGHHRTVIEYLSGAKYISGRLEGLAQESSNTTIKELLFDFSYCVGADTIEDYLSLRQYEKTKKDIR